MPPAPGFWGEPPTLGLPPSLPRAGTRWSGWLRRGVTLEGVFPTQRTRGDPLTPQICSAVPAFSCWGSWGPGSAQTGVVTVGCMLHPSCLGLFGGG